PLPAVRRRDRARDLTFIGGERRSRPEPFAFCRRLLEWPRQLRQRPATRPSPDVVRGEETAHLVPERARLARRPVVAGGLADEIQPARRARARGVEEISIPRDVVARREPRIPADVELAAQIVGEKRRLVSAPRQAPFLESEHENDVRPA